MRYILYADRVTEDVEMVETRCVISETLYRNRRHNADIWVWTVLLRRMSVGGKSVGMIDCLTTFI